MFQDNKGFSLIEILISISIIILIIAIATISYRSFEKETELEVVAQNILVTLKLAQTQTLASEDASQYGVHFEIDKYILFKGNTYQSTAADNKIYQLPSRLEIFDIDLIGGATSTVFQRINGTTEQNGAVSLRIISQPAKLETIIIHSSGQIELGATSTECCTANRLTDSRHIHLTLGWSIQGANLLTLYFSDTPEVTIDIPMADYFNSDQTEFDWSGIIDVNGQNQELHIHTHFLDAIDTLLCVHRDRDKNNKPLQILIDGQDIISYTNDGEATIGFWSSVMEIQ